MGRRLLIGLVTHEGSRFREDALAQLAVIETAARSAGWDVERLVSARDDYDAVRFPVTRRMLVRSALAQAVLEYRWRRYLAAGESRGAVRTAVGWLRDTALLAGMSLVRTARYLSPWPGAALERLHGTRAVIRLLNIDLSHLRVLTAGAESGADWTLVLEDDARVADPSTAVTSLLGSLDAAQSHGVRYVTASRSIDHGELGVERLLSSAVDGRRVAERPVTNTVCAVAYPAPTARWFADRIVADGLVPVVPIDWRLNRALMSAVAHGDMGPGSCWVLDPAPFTQGSMH